MTNKTILEAQAEALESVFDDAQKAGLHAPGTLHFIACRAHALRTQAEAAQPEKDDWKPTGTEPRGCPTPGACSCPAISAGELNFDKWLEKNRNRLLSIGTHQIARDAYAVGFSAHHPDSGEWQAARSHQAQAVEGETPRVDKALNAASLSHNDTLVQVARAARQLERELNAAIATPPTQQEALAPVGEHAKLVAALRKFPQFFRNGSHWIRSVGIEPLCQRAADCIEALSTPSPQAVPEGFVLVPTDAMVEAMDLFFENSSFVNVSPAQRRAMLEAALSAAPPAPAKDGEKS